MIGIFSALSACLSFVYSFFNNSTGSVTSEILNEPVNAINLVIYLAGGMAFWNGIMNVAEKAGITEFIAKILKVPLKIIFKGVNPNEKAFKLISMNISANIMGLGNAATPIGIEAMKALEEETCNENDDEISDSMVLFAVTNTASLTVIPTTMASFRLKYGSQSPFDIMPAVIFSSFFTLVTALLVSNIGNTIHKIRKRGKS